MIDTVIQVASVGVAIVSCVYTYKTYRKSGGILDLVKYSEERKWNNEQFTKFFRYFPFDSLESFLGNPADQSGELMKALGRLDLSTFMFEGKEKEVVVSFVKSLDAFCGLPYKEVLPDVWKFQPLPPNVPFDAAKERDSIRELEDKARAVVPLYLRVKELLAKYHVDIDAITRQAHEYYRMQKEAERI